MKILAVCGFGVGSSMVLKMNIDKVAEEKDIDAQVETADLSTATSSGADVIFTSQELVDDLKASTNVPVYPIQKFMDKNEIKEAFDDYLENH